MVKYKKLTITIGEDIIKEYNIYNKTDRPKDTLWNGKWYHLPSWRVSTKSYSPSILPSSRFIYSWSDNISYSKIDNIRPMVFIRNQKLKFTFNIKDVGNYSSYQIKTASHKNILKEGSSNNIINTIKKILSQLKKTHNAWHKRGKKHG